MVANLELHGLVKGMVRKVGFDIGKGGLESFHHSTKLGGTTIKERIVNLPLGTRPSGWLSRRCPSIAAGGGPHGVDVLGGQKGFVAPGDPPPDRAVNFSRKTSEIEKNEVGFLQFRMVSYFRKK